MRPVSTYATQNREIQRISVRPPEFKGTIRGKVTASSGRHFLTISTDQSNFVTVRVVISDEEFEALQVGQRVMSGVYNPLTLEVAQLVVLPAKSHQSHRDYLCIGQGKRNLDPRPYDRRAHRALGA